MSLAALHYFWAFVTEYIYTVCSSSLGKRKSQACTHTCCLNGDSVPPAAPIKWVDKKKKAGKSARLQTRALITSFGVFPI